jgi:hypothetical protein
MVALVSGVSSADTRFCDAMVLRSTGKSPRGFLEMSFSALAWSVKKPSKMNLEGLPLCADDVVPCL